MDQCFAASDPPTASCEPGLHDAQSVLLARRLSPLTEIELPKITWSWSKPRSRRLHLVMRSTMMPKMMCRFNTSGHPKSQRLRPGGLVDPILPRDLLCETSKSALYR